MIIRTKNHTNSLNSTNLKFKILNNPCVLRTWLSTHHKPQHVDTLINQHLTPFILVKDIYEQI